MSDCIFCKIASKELPSYTVYEDENFMGFLDIHPIAKGHVQLIPKKHFRWTYDVPQFGQYFEVARMVGLATERAVNADYISFVTFGIEVEHAHIWIVPRFKGDIHEGSGINTTNRLQFTIEEYLAIQKQIVHNNI
jgi:histidine triad (HIT) family protein